MFRFGTVGEKNVQGEDVKKLDVLANELFINMIKSSYTSALMVSEENEHIIQVSFCNFLTVNQLLLQFAFR